MVEEDGVTLPNGDRFPVKEIMDSWVLQNGIPLLNVTRSGNILRFDQKRYVANPYVSMPPSDFNYLWNIPITIANTRTGPGNTSTLHFVRTKESEYTYPETIGDWFALNSLSTGYYRVRYDIESEESLLSQLRSDINSVDGISRAQMLDDAFSYTSRGYRPEVEALPFTTFLKSEGIAGAWIAAIDGLSSLYDKYTDLDNVDIGRYTRSIVDNMYDQLGFEPKENEADFTAFVRGIVSSGACSFGNQKCIDKANELVNIYREQKQNRLVFNFLKFNQNLS